MYIPGDYVPKMCIIVSKSWSNAQKGGIFVNETEIFAPWRIVCSFGDGARLTFDGLTEQQAVAAMEAAQAEHGDITWWDRVTDVNYEDGRYYKTLPQAPVVTVIDYDGYTGPLDDQGFPSGLPDRIAHEGTPVDPDNPRIIIKRHAPKEGENNA